MAATLCVVALPWNCRIARRTACLARQVILDIISTSGCLQIWLRQQSCTNSLSFLFTTAPFLSRSPVQIACAIAPGKRDSLPLHCATPNRCPARKPKSQWGQRLHTLSSLASPFSKVMHGGMFFCAPFAAHFTQSCSKEVSSLLLQAAPMHPCVPRCTHACPHAPMHPSLHGRAPSLYGVCGGSRRTWCDPPQALPLCSVMTGPDYMTPRCLPPLPLPLIAAWWHWVTNTCS